MTVHTLLQKNLTIGTRLGVSEEPLPCHTILTDPHDVHITVLQLGRVSKLLDTVTLGMDRILAVPTSTTTTTDTIGCDTHDLAAMNEHRNMKARIVGLLQSAGIGILQKTLQQGVVPLLRGLHGS